MFIECRMARERQREGVEADHRGLFRKVQAEGGAPAKGSECAINTYDLVHLARLGDHVYRKPPSAGIPVNRE